MDYDYRMTAYSGNSGRYRKSLETTNSEFKLLDWISAKKCKLLKLEEQHHIFQTEWNLA